MRVHRVAGHREVDNASLRTKDISSSGVYFLSPHRIEPGTPVELHFVLVNRPLGRASVCMRTEAHVVRIEEASRVGWHGIAVAFDDISFSQGKPVASGSQAG